MEFSKYHGAGNDFIIMSNMWLQMKDVPDLVRKSCDRHFGIGADGFILAEPSNSADIKMNFFNSDGSIASMCGNGIRCFSKYVWDNGLIKNKNFKIETGDGIKNAEIVKSLQTVSDVKVSVGNYSDMDILKVNTQIGDFSVISMHMGVPHAVLFTDSEMRSSTGRQGMDALDALAGKYGRYIEKAEVFPKGTNVNFVMILDKTKLLCSTWERGAGKTLACGTGASASAVAAFSYLDCDSQIEVNMPGGKVTVIVSPDKTVKMLGQAQLICKGEFYND